MISLLFVEISQCVNHRGILIKWYLINLNTLSYDNIYITINSEYRVAHWQGFLLRLTGKYKNATVKNVVECITIIYIYIYMNNIYILITIKTQMPRHKPNQQYFAIRALT